MFSDILFLSKTTYINFLTTISFTVNDVPDYEDNLIIEYKGNYTYTIAKLDNYNIVHVKQNSMRSMGRDSIINTINDAVRNNNPYVVIMTVIAIGIDNKKITLVM